MESTISSRDDPLKGPFAGEQAIDDHPEGPEIGPMIQAASQSACSGAMYFSVPRRTP